MSNGQNKPYNYLQPGNRLSLGWLLIFIAINTLLVIFFMLSRNSYDNLLDDANQQMNRLQSNLESTLGQHAYLPAFLANLPSVRKFADEQPTQTSVVEAFNLQLEQLSSISNTLDIYLMRTDGRTIASSNWQMENTFMGKNFAFRPYFQQAMDGRLGRYFALGTTSGERGYYFAYPVRNDENLTVAVIVVKVDISAIESIWKNTDFEFMITDEDNVVFMSSKQEWQIKSLLPLSMVSLESVYKSRRYADKTIRPLDNFNQSNLDAETDYAILSGKNYLHIKKEMLAEGWTLHILADRQSTQQNLYLTFILSLFVVLLSCTLIYLMIRNQKQRGAYELQVRKELRSKIDARTQELKLAQEELVQAAKMAALGELSAGINHELNNPLTAIRSYSDNAIQFLEQGQYDIVKSNLSEISNLTETMAAIARQLKTFSRKSSGDLDTVDLKHALDSALLIVNPKLSRENVDFIKNIDSEITEVTADLLWLEQIIVNLMNNAIEAITDQAIKSIQMNVSSQADRVLISIHDNGPGIDEIHINQIFEAFFTTKDPGKGLGLGLSISYRLAKDMQGNLTANNAEGGGAVFTLELKTASPSETSYSAGSITDNSSKTQDDNDQNS